jgi:hypothetical protein
MGGSELDAAEAPPHEGLVEARRLHWRRPTTEATLRRDGHRWTLWTIGVVVTFAAPAVFVTALNAWLAPIAVLLVVHGTLILRLQAGRAVKSLLPLGAQMPGPRAVAPPGPAAEGAALGLLGDLLDHRERDLLHETGLAMQRGKLGVWLLGQRGALLVRPGGRRLFSFCVRVAESGDLPAGDRVAHLLLALREDEQGFATVANQGFSGAVWRCRHRMQRPQRLTLDAARSAARTMRAGAPGAAASGASLSSAGA